MNIPEACDLPRSPRARLGCVKRSIFRPINCIASTSSEDPQSKRESFRILESNESEYLGGNEVKVAAAERAWELEQNGMFFVLISPQRVQ
ncbi:hypothetical protein Pyn_31373 [Prunus yedoensis var. nudiflora]|uniref:Uncharacterized protein n=1 Tax=Prunus yedoensis var. nudiflora TaxID=2094558 RepID=A0A314YWL1_PRUYE|nr:hypothetical protein Pyn_31373 [Prunus yedoensis var. nudiflora]